MARIETHAQNISNSFRIVYSLSLSLYIYIYIHILLHATDAREEFAVQLFETVSSDIKHQAIIVECQRNFNFLTIIRQLLSSVQQSVCNVL